MSAQPDQKDEEGEKDTREVQLHKSLEAEGNTQSRIVIKLICLCLCGFVCVL